MNENKIIPFDNIPPSSFLDEALRDRGLSYGNFAEKLGMKLGDLYPVLTDRRPITLELGEKISNILGYDGNYWHNLSKTYWMRLVVEKLSNGDVDTAYKSLVSPR